MTRCTAYCIAGKNKNQKFGIKRLFPPKKIITVVHDFNGHGVNGMHGVNGKNCYDGPFYVVNNGKIHVWL